MIIQQAFFAKGALALTALALPIQASAQSWLCIADKATGFRFDPVSKDWRPTGFKVESSRYIFKRTGKEDIVWVVEKFGSKSMVPEAWCETDFDQAGFLHCYGLGGRFVLNQATGRFQNYFQGSYVAFNPAAKSSVYRSDGGDTPFVEIGQCSEL